MHNLDIYHDISHCLIHALEAKDLYTSGHSSRVGNMALDLAKNLSI